MAEAAIPPGGAIAAFLEHTPLAVFALLLGLSVLVPPVARLLRLPDLVGLLAAGVLIGPHVLGWIDSQTPTADLLSDVGVIYLLFIAGLEIDLAEFARIRQRSFRFGLLTFTLPLLGGAALALASGYGWLSAVLLGSVLASHTPLGYPIVRSYGAVREESVIVAIGGTIFTDLAALLLLALCMGLSRGELTPLGVLALLARVGLFAAMVIALITRLGENLVRRSVNNESQLFVAVVLALFLAALGAELAGVEKIVGAFLAGLAVNHVLPEGRVKEQVIFVGAALFIPIFFIDLGLLLDLPGFLGTMLAGPFAIALIGTLITAKGLAAWWAGRIYRYNHAQILTLWSLSLPQVAATLAATFVGYKAGLFDTTVLNSVLAMMVVTASLGPALTARAMPLLGQAAATAIRAELNGSLALARRSLRVLVPVSNPSTEAPLLGLASLLIQGDGEDPGQVLPLVVVSPAQTVSTAMASAMAEARTLLGSAASQLGSERVPCQTLLRVDSDVAAGIARVAIEQASDLVVMGLAPPAGLGQWLFGDLVDATCRQVTCPVVVARLQQPPATLRRLLVPVKDLTAGALEQFQLAERLALAQQGSITLLHVAESARSRRARQAMEQQLAGWRRGAGALGPPVPIDVRVMPHRGGGGAGGGGGVERWITAAAREHDLVILRSQRRLVAGLPIPASDRVDRLLRRLPGSVLVISDPLH